MNAQYVTASEVAEYIYCECCWADKLEGKREETKEMLAGSKTHDSIHKSYQLVTFIKQVAIVVVIGSAILVGILILLYRGGLL